MAVPAAEHDLLGARSSAQLVRAERDLQVFNADLERRICERTAALEFEAGVRGQAEQKLLIHMDRLRLLDQITRAIGERQDLRSIYQVLVRSLEDRLPVEFACVCTYDAARHVLRVDNVGVASLSLARELAMPEQAEVGIDNNGFRAVSPASWSTSRTSPPCRIRFRSGWRKAACVRW